MTHASTDKTRKFAAIRIEDHEQIEAYLKTVNGRADVHVAKIEDIISAAERAEDRLIAAGLPKEFRVGAELSATTEGAARSYKYAVAGTHFTLIRQRSGWKLTYAEKVVVFAGQREKFDLSVSPDVAEEIKKRSVAEFKIKKAA